jgi:glycosyl transferase family 25
LSDPPTTPILVISLKAATDRREGFARRAEDARLEWRFFDAHESLAPGLVYDEAKARLYQGRPLSTSELACYSSHVAAWEALLAGPSDQLIVLEDDVIVDWPMLRLVAGTDFPRSGIDYLRLYQKQLAPFRVRKTDYLVRRHSVVELFSTVYGAQGYVITRAAVERLLPYFRTIKVPIDDQLDRFWDHGLPNLCLFPFPLIEQTIVSTIGAGRFGPTDRSWRRLAFRIADRIRREIAIVRRRLTYRVLPDPVPLPAARP